MRTMGEDEGMVNYTFSFLVLMLPLFSLVACIFTIEQSQNSDFEA